MLPGVAVSTIVGRSRPFCARADRTEQTIIISWPVASGCEAADRRIDLGTREANVPECTVVELAKACNGGATDEIARNPYPARIEKSEDMRCVSSSRQAGR
jgi:hypothetical protein